MIRKSGYRFSEKIMPQCNKSGRRLIQSPRIRLWWAQSRRLALFIRAIHSFFAEITVTVTTVMVPRTFLPLRV